MEFNIYQYNVYIFRFLSRIQTNSLLNWTSDMKDMKMDYVKNSAFQLHLLFEMQGHIVFDKVFTAIKGCLPILTKK